MAGGKTNVVLDSPGRVGVEHGSLKGELDDLLKQWDESTERFCGAGGTDSLNGNPQRSAQAGRGSSQHGKAAGGRTQSTAAPTPTGERARRRLT